jgi:predicted DCC family thiol-disulfide oxidoreductase YuxK
MAGSISPVKPKTKAGMDGKDWTFYYDGDCGFCTRVVRVMSKLDRRRRVNWVAFQFLDALPGDLTRSDLQREAYIERGETLEGGFYAFRRLTLLLPPLWLLAPVMWFPGMNKLGEAAYAWIARNRTRLPGSVCSIE